MSAADPFSEVMGARRGAQRPAPPLPKVILLRNPGEDWRACLLRDSDELLMNLSALGLEDQADDGNRELMVDVGALLLHSVQENPAISDDELNDIAAYGLELFREMSVEERSRRMRTPSAELPS